MPRGFSGNLIFAIIAPMLCGNHLKITYDGQKLTSNSLNLAFTFSAPLNYFIACLSYCARLLLRILLACIPTNDAFPTTRHYLQKTKPMVSVIFVPRRQLPLVGKAWSVGITSRWFEQLKSTKYHQSVRK